MDYYEVVKKTGQTVALKPIGATEVPGSQGFMCATVKPVPGAFISNSYKLRKQNADGTTTQLETLRKKVQYTPDGRAYLSFEYGWCDVTTPAESHYSSWYA